MKLLTMHLDPGRLQLNGEPTDRFTYNPGTGVLGVSLAAGESRIEVTNAP